MQRFLYDLIKDEVVVSFERCDSLEFSEIVSEYRQNHSIELSNDNYNML